MKLINCPKHHHKSCERRRKKHSLSEEINKSPKVPKSEEGNKHPNSFISDKHFRSDIDTETKNYTIIKESVHQKLQ